MLAETEALTPQAAVHTYRILAGCVTHCRCTHTESLDQTMRVKVKHMERPDPHLVPALVPQAPVDAVPIHMDNVRMRTLSM